MLQGFQCLHMYSILLHSTFYEGDFIENQQKISKEVLKESVKKIDSQHPVYYILDSESNKSSSTDFGGYNTPPMSADSPISQSSPFTMSPLSPGGSPLSSGVNSPSQAGSFPHGSYSGMNSVAGTGMDDRTPGVMLKIHSRRFRE